MADTYAKNPEDFNKSETSKKNDDVRGGLWVHPNGTSAITQDDPLFGNAMSQSFKRLGFVWQREALPGEVKQLPELALAARKTEESSVKGLDARLSQLEDDAAAKAKENAELNAELVTLRQEKADRDAADAAAAPVDTVPVADQTSVPTELAPEQVGTPANPDFQPETPLQVAQTAPGNPDGSLSQAPADELPNGDLGETPVDPAPVDSSVPAQPEQ